MTLVLVFTQTALFVPQFGIVAEPAIALPGVAFGDMDAPPAPFASLL
jgi:hypothetical protein